MLTPKLISPDFKQVVVYLPGDLLTIYKLTHKTTGAALSALIPWHEFPASL